jgi:protocatechuate 3,4-dioxygenase, alpha subunit
MSLQATTSQTVGPFFTIGCTWLNRDDLTASGISGERVTIEGRVVDGDGKGVPDSLLEVWQANGYGRYNHPDDDSSKPLEQQFFGFGRIPTDAAGRFRFKTVKPGSVLGPGGKPQAPHIVVSVFMRGLLKRLVTRIYFPDEPLNASDYALGLVDPARRETLIASRTGASSGALEWNVILQGPGETVFFDC